MRELEKILEEINEASFPLELLGEGDTRFITVSLVEEIIRKHTNDGWVSAEERLPEYGKKVLSYGKSGEIDIASLYSRDKHMWLVGSMCSVAFDIIAWQPLPAPYRPERSEE